MKNRHIAHLIPHLGVGGSEKMMLKLAQYGNRKAYDVSVITFWQDDTLTNQCHDLGIKVYALKHAKSYFPLKTFIQLRSLLRQLRPDILHAWLYPSFLFSVCIWRNTWNAKIIWNIRHAPDCIQSRAGKGLAWLCKKLVAYIPDAVISCSQQAAKAHQLEGWQVPMYCIPNGFSLQNHRIPQQDSLIIGKIARFTPAKDHATFIRAASIFRKSYPHARFILCGKDCDDNNAMLIHCLEQYGIRDAFVLLGEQANTNEILKSLQICSLSSFTEGFPNVLGEAICQNVMCISTSAGEVAHLLGDKQWTTPIGDAEALAMAWQRFVTLSSEQQTQARNYQFERLRTYFDIHNITLQYEQLYNDLLKEKITC